ncbi:hypothetical protein BDV34DRAFT_191021 [Aspergillus parasiticus]|uniref:Uncharacterized protein n=1 Tax=Aspergillus parasiticus TaxID=5067 RepID=A0A5N6DSF8_ASPPA|nr:hypothetical protein BDV34DRAFT_191021 [Aspergillus parasiticus]
MRLRCTADINVLTVSLHSMHTLSEQSFQALKPGKTNPRNQPISQTHPGHINPNPNPKVHPQT